MSDVDSIHSSNDCVRVLEKLEHDNIDAPGHVHLGGEELLRSDEFVRSRSSTIAEIRRSFHRYRRNSAPCVNDAIIHDGLLCSNEPSCSRQSTDSLFINHVVEELVEAVETSTAEVVRSSGTLVTSPGEPPVVDDEQLLRMHLKHVFVLSEAGKPIYTRYGHEEDLSPLMGVLQALVSSIGSDDKVSPNQLRRVSAGSLHMIFLHRPPLILVAVSRDPRLPWTHLSLQLEYMHSQIISVLTNSQLTRIFEARNNFDLRRLLSGTERTLNRLLNFCDSDPAAVLGAISCLPLLPSSRETIGNAMAQAASKAKNLVFAILTTGSQLIAMARLKKYSIHPVDLHLVFNLVEANPSFRHAESWSPICLPRFDNSGFLHAHISYLWEACPACLLLLTTDRDAFFTMADVRNKILERLNKGRTRAILTEAIAKPQYVMSELTLPTDLWHFLYKNRQSAQFTAPAISTPYWTDDERQRLFGRYLSLHSYMHSDRSPLKIYHLAGESETMLGWITTGFDLYAVFSPMVTKHAAIALVDKLIKWLKKEEDRLFILNSPLY